MLPAEEEDWGSALLEAAASRNERCGA